MQQRPDDRDEPSPQSAELFHLIVENIKDYAVFTTDADGLVVSWNPGVERLLGYAETEIVGQPIEIIFTPEDRAAGAHLKEMQTAAQSGRAEDKRWHLRKDGSRFWANGLAMPLKADDGALRGFAKVMRDDTAQKLAEQNLIERERLARLGIEISESLVKNDSLSDILRHCTDAVVKHLDAAFARIWLLDREENVLELKASSGIYTHLDGEHSRVPVGKFKIGWIAAERQPHLTNCVVGDERVGEQEWARREEMVAFAGYPLLVEDRLVGVAALFSRQSLDEHSLDALASVSNTIALGIERKQAEEAARAATERFEIVAQATNDAIWDWNLTTDKVWWNDGVRTLFGYAPEAVSGTAEWWYEHIHPEDRERVVADIHRVIDSGGQEWSDEYRYLKADGTFAEVFDRGFVIRDPEGKPVRAMGGMTDITERKRAEEKLREAEEQFRAAFEQAAVGVSQVAPDGTWLRVNQRLCEIVGYSEEELLARTFQDITHPDDLESDLNLVRQILAGEIEIYSLEKRYIRKDGSLIWINLTVSLVRDPSGAPKYFVSVIEDISERKRIEEERLRLLQSEQAAREQAEQANRLKDEFLATLSHELRTPLNAILGWSQMLQTRNVGETETKKALATIERSARAQNQLIEDILDVSRIITGKLRLDVRAVDLPSVIMAATDAARPAAEAKNIRLQTLLDPSAGPISGDPDRLQQVVWNLLSNAIKFTDKNGRAQVRLERINSHVEIVVSDTGKGIEAEFLPHVFDRFRQSDGSMTRRHGGLGLGLAIVRQLVELHGGTVSVSSAGRGHGATFTVNLPLLPVRQEPASDFSRVHPAAAVGALPDCPPELDRLRVLLVEDEADSRDLLLVVLESCGARVVAASSAAEALELIRSERFDVVVSDIGMPEEDGFSLIGKIRELPIELGGDVPAIALTAYARAEDRVQALRSGFQMHVAKPVEPAELVAVVANLAGRMRKPNRS